jgi:Bacterial PH domain
MTPNIITDSARNITPNMPKTKPFVAREHEFEAQYGLPEHLPATERILWQGAPSWLPVAREVFHADKVALYFCAMLIWRVASALDDGASWGNALASATWLVPLFGLAVGALLLLGWLTARTTAYTLTDKRVVMRIGIVLTVTYNLPLRCIESADLRARANGQGDITLALEPGTRIAWLQLWPHVRPWRLAKTQPMLRGLQGAPQVAALLQQAWDQVNGAAGMAAASPKRPAQHAPLQQPSLAQS